MAAAPKDGVRVSYIGLSDGTLSLGDRGQVLSAGPVASHVKMATGALAGQIVPLYNDDLAPLGREAMQDDLTDSLEVGGLVNLAAREVFEVEGEAGVINRLAEDGHLAAFQAIAEDALTLITSRVRSDPSIRAVTAQLDEEEGEAVVRLASQVLLRDAFGSAE